MNHKPQLLDKFQKHDAAVGVIGLGYVGLPLALAFAERGFRAIGLDVDASTGEMYGLTDTPTATRGLYKFDLAGQSESFIAPYPAGETDIDALAVDSGRAYYVTDGPLGTQPNFYVFDVSTGTQIGTLPSPFTGSGTFSAATFVPVPEPTSVGLIALAIGAFATRRR